MVVAVILGGKVHGLSRSCRKNDRQNRNFHTKIINFQTALPRSILTAVFRWFPTQGAFRSRRGRGCGRRRAELRLLTARNFLLAEGSRKPEFGGTHGGERGYASEHRAGYQVRPPTHTHPPVQEPRRGARPREGLPYGLLAVGLSDSGFDPSAARLFSSFSQFGASEWARFSRMIRPRFRRDAAAFDPWSRASRFLPQCKTGRRSFLKSSSEIFF